MDTCGSGLDIDVLAAFWGGRMIGWNTSGIHLHYALDEKDETTEILGEIKGCECGHAAPAPDDYICIFNN